MSGQTYTYEVHVQWKWTHDYGLWEIPSDADYQSHLIADMAKAFPASLAAQMAPTGHWYKFDDINTTIKSSTGGYVFGLPPIWRVNTTGETIIHFESDVQDASIHNSPGLWEVVQTAIQQIIQYLGQHPEIVVGMIIVAGLTIVYIQMVNTTTKAAQDIGKTLQDVGSNIGAAVIVLGVLAVAGLGIYALFFTGTGRKAASKGYQTATRGYSAVRRRLK